MSILAKDGRARIVAMDHAQTHGVIAGLEDPGAVIDTALEAGSLCAEHCLRERMIHERATAPDVLDELAVA